jgi:hypothetical protein
MRRGACWQCVKNACLSWRTSLHWHALPVRFPFTCSAKYVTYHWSITFHNHGAAHAAFIPCHECCLVFCSLRKVACASTRCSKQPHVLPELFPSLVHVLQVAEAPRPEQRAADMLLQHHVHCNDLTFNETMTLIDAPKRIAEMHLDALRPFLGQYYQASCHLCMCQCMCLEC